MNHDLNISFNPQDPDEEEDEDGQRERWWDGAGMWEYQRSTMDAKSGNAAFLRAKSDAMFAKENPKSEKSGTI